MNREEILQTIKDLIANGNIEEANALLNEQATFLADYYDQAAGLFENLDTVQIPFFNNKETILLLWENFQIYSINKYLDDEGFHVICKCNINIRSSKCRSDC